MRIIRVRHRGRAFYASLEENGEKLHCLQNDLGYTDLINMREVSLSPLVSPSKIVCVGLNFQDHAKELDMPLPGDIEFFLKPPSSLLFGGQSILIPHGVGRVDFEAELGIVIGQFCRNVLPENAPDFIFGYTCANDVTARDVQKGETLIGRSKGYDTFCPLGPWIETTPPPMDAGIRTLVNGKLRQNGTLSNMIVPPLELVSRISHMMSLSPGDVILTGTPAGVGPILPGDRVQIEIDNVGVMGNEVQMESQSGFFSELPGRRLQ